MKKISLCIVAIFILALGSCNNHSGEKGTEKTEPTAKAVKIKLSELATAQDLICGMKLEEGEVGDTTLYQGKTYGFCSSECKAEFLKDPQAHLAQK